MLQKVHTGCERLSCTWRSVQEDNLAFAFAIYEVCAEQFRVVGVSLCDRFDKILVVRLHDEPVDRGLSHAGLLQPRHIQQVYISSACTSRMTRIALFLP